MQTHTQPQVYCTRVHHRWWLADAFLHAHAHDQGCDHRVHAHGRRTGRCMRHVRVSHPRAAASCACACRCAGCSAPACVSSRSTQLQSCHGLPEMLGCTVRFPIARPINELNTCWGCMQINAEGVLFVRQTHDPLDNSRQCCCDRCLSSESDKRSACTERKEEHAIMHCQAAHLKCETHQCTASCTACHKAAGRPTTLVASNPDKLPQE